MIKKTQSFSRSPEPLYCNARFNYLAIFIEKKKSLGGQAKQRQNEFLANAHI